MRYLAVFASQLEIEFNPSLHGSIDRVGNIFGQVAAKTFTAERHLAFVIRRYLIQVSETLVACRGKIDLATVLVRHPHRKDKPEAGVTMPEFGQVKDSPV